MFLHKLAQQYNEQSEETSIHTEILEELSLWLEYGTLLYMRLGAADLAMRKSNFVLVSMDDVTSVTSRAVTLLILQIPRLRVAHLGYCPLHATTCGH